MGSKPSTATNVAAAVPTTSGTDATPVNATVAETVSSARATTSTSGLFGMPHALVIIACIATAAILAPPAMSINDILFLMAGAGTIGTAVVMAVVTGGRRGTDGRISRFMRAYFTSGS
ncbi:hypothetical protein [Streptomyces umbrinus]|uniref:hypothetical protein n=1 Tax=Streptomyces umbrinus TaxID=67370 RepID=UPI003C2FFEB2